MSHTISGFVVPYHLFISLTFFIQFNLKFAFFVVFNGKVAVVFSILIKIIL